MPDIRSVKSGRRDGVVGSRMWSFVNNDDRYSDAWIMCQGGAFLPAHRVVLAASSSYLEGIFQKLAKAPNAAAAAGAPVIILPEVDASLMKKILEFIYRGEASWDAKKIPEVLKIAEYLKIVDLKDALNAPTSNARNSGEGSKKRKIDDDGSDVESVHSKYSDSFARGDDAGSTARRGSGARGGGKKPRQTKAASPKPKPRARQPKSAAAKAGPRSKTKVADADSDSDKEGGSSGWAIQQKPKRAPRSRAKKPAADDDSSEDTPKPAQKTARSRNKSPKGNASASKASARLTNGGGDVHMDSDEDETPVPPEAIHELTCKRKVLFELKRLSEDKLKAMLADDKENEVVVNGVGGDEDE